MDDIMHGRETAQISNFDRDWSIRVGGTLHIMINIELHYGPPTYIPDNPLCETVQGMFMNKEYADIVFEEGGQQFNDDARKLAKTLPVRFPLTDSFC